jgi:hypothetical protein
LDAVAVKWADGFLSGRDTSFVPSELRRLAAVLTRYGRVNEAGRIRLAVDNPTSFAPTAVTAAAGLSA